MKELYLASSPSPPLAAASSLASASRRRHRPQPQRQRRLLSTLLLCLLVGIVVGSNICPVAAQKPRRRPGGGKPVGPRRPLPTKPGRPTRPKPGNPNGGGTGTGGRSIHQLLRERAVMNPRNGHRYLFMDDRVTRDEAARIAKEARGYLVTITDDNEKRFILTKVWDTVDRSQHNEVWIGARRPSPTADFRWDQGPERGGELSKDGRGYDAWDELEPNNAGTNEACASQNVDRNQKWNDIACDSQFTYIIEWDHFVDCEFRTGDWSVCQISWKLKTRGDTCDLRAGSGVQTARITITKQPNERGVPCPITTAGQFMGSPKSSTNSVQVIARPCVHADVFDMKCVGDKNQRRQQHQYSWRTAPAITAAIMDKERRGGPNAITRTWLTDFPYQRHKQMWVDHYRARCCMLPETCVSFAFKQASGLTRTSSDVVQCPEGHSTRLFTAVEVANHLNGVLGGMSACRGAPRTSTRRDRKGGRPTMQPSSCSPSSCCRPNKTCAAITCPDGMIKRPDADRRVCRTRDCRTEVWRKAKCPSPLQLVCKQARHRSSFDGSGRAKGVLGGTARVGSTDLCLCSPDITHRDTVSPVSPERQYTFDQCCEPFHLCAAMTTSCPAGQHRRKGEKLRCTKPPACEDCCEANPTCDTDGVAGTGFVCDPAQGVRKSAASSPSVCQGAECAFTECCAAAKSAMHVYANTKGGSGALAIIVNGDTSPSMTDGTLFAEQQADALKSKTDDSTQQRFVVKNEGNVALTVTSVTLTDDASAPGQKHRGTLTVTATAITGAVIAVGEQAEFSVTFNAAAQTTTPRYAGDVRAVVTVSTTTEAAPTPAAYTFVVAGLLVRGTLVVSGGFFGTAPFDVVIPSSAASPSSTATTQRKDGTDFGTVWVHGNAAVAAASSATDVGSNAAREVSHTFTVRNTGNGNVRLTGSPTVMSSHTAEFSIAQAPSPQVLAPNADTTFTVTFRPVVASAAVSAAAAEATPVRARITIEVSTGVAYVFDVSGRARVLTCGDAAAVTSSANAAPPAKPFECDAATQHARDGMATQTCAGDACTAAECCVDNDTCAGYVCATPTQQYHRKRTSRGEGHTAFEPPCPQAKCTRDDCCDPDATCATTTCVAEFSHAKPNAADVRCPRNFCDEQECCDDHARCTSEFVCAPAAKWHLKSIDSGLTDIVCTGGTPAGSECTVEKDCCAPNPMCSSAPASLCGGGKTTLRLDATTTQCDGAECTAATCCVDNPTCGGGAARPTAVAGATTLVQRFDCAAEGRYHLPDDKLTHVCATDTCVRDECCVATPTCAEAYLLASLTCAPGTTRVLDHSKDVRDDGTPPPPPPPRCKGAVCTQADCCRPAGACTGGGSGQAKAFAGCGVGTHLKPRPPTHCKAAMCKQVECCDANAVCGAAFESCGVGSHQPTSTQTKTCAAAVCTRADCCVANATCDAAFKCPPLKHLRADAVGKACAAAVCVPDDCCVTNASCSAAVPCTSGWNLKPDVTVAGATPIVCKAAQCTSDDCCNRGGRCAGIATTTPATEAVVCGAGTHAVADFATRVCPNPAVAIPGSSAMSSTAIAGGGDVACSQAWCCRGNPTCAAFVCNVDDDTAVTRVNPTTFMTTSATTTAVFVPRPMPTKPIVCAAATCTTKDCCVPTATCVARTCPRGFRDKPRKASIFCATSPTDAAAAARAGGTITTAAAADAAEAARVDPNAFVCTTAACCDDVCDDVVRAKCARLNREPCVVDANDDTCGACLSGHRAEGQDPRRPCRLRPVYCPAADGFQVTTPGDTATKPCPDSDTHTHIRGEVTRHCGAGGVWAPTTKTRCGTGLCTHFTCPSATDDPAHAFKKPDGTCGGSDDADGICTPAQCCQSTPSDPCTSDAVRTCTEAHMLPCTPSPTDVTKMSAACGACMPGFYQAVGVGGVVPVGDITIGGSRRGVCVRDPCTEARRARCAAVHRAPCKATESECGACLPQFGVVVVGVDATTPKTPKAPKTPKTTTAESANAGPCVPFCPALPATSPTTRGVAVVTTPPGGTVTLPCTSPTTSPTTTTVAIVGERTLRCAGDGSSWLPPIDTCARGPTRGPTPTPTPSTPTPTPLVVDVGCDALAKAHCASLQRDSCSPAAASSTAVCGVCLRGFVPSPPTTPTAPKRSSQCVRDRCSAAAIAVCASLHRQPCVSGGVDGDGSVNSGACQYACEAGHHRPVVADGVNADIADEDDACAPPCAEEKGATPSTTTWPTTMPGAVATVPCTSSATTPVRSRKCEIDGRWSRDVDDSQCVATPTPTPTSTSTPTPTPVVELCSVADRRRCRQQHRHPCTATEAVCGACLPAHHVPPGAVGGAAFGACVADVVVGVDDMETCTAALQRECAALHRAPCVVGASPPQRDCAGCLAGWDEPDLVDPHTPAVPTQTRRDANGRAVACVDRRVTQVVPTPTPTTPTPTTPTPTTPTPTPTTPTPTTPTPSPVDCSGTFSEYVDCSVTCGVGTRTRTFDETVAAANGGKPCVTTPLSESCSLGDCPPPLPPNQHGCVGVWSSFTPCSATCGDGTQSQVFTPTGIDADNADCVHKVPPNTRACKVESCASSTPTPTPTPRDSKKVSHIRPGDPDKTDDIEATQSLLWLWITIPLLLCCVVIVVVVYRQHRRHDQQEFKRVRGKDAGDADDSEMTVIHMSDVGEGTSGGGVDKPTRAAAISMVSAVSSMEPQSASKQQHAASTTGVSAIDSEVRENKRLTVSGLAAMRTEISKEQAAKVANHARDGSIMNFTGLLRIGDFNDGLDRGSEDGDESGGSDETGNTGGPTSQPRSGDQTLKQQAQARVRRKKKQRQAEMEQQAMYDDLDQADE